MAMQKDSIKFDCRSTGSLLYFSFVPYTLKRIEFIQGKYVEAKIRPEFMCACANVSEEKSLFLKACHIQKQYKHAYKHVYNINAI